MVASGEARDEERHYAVAEELVDDAIPFVDYPGRRPVEARHQARELLRQHALGDRCRPADVRKQHRDLDLGAPRVLVNRADAKPTEPSVQWRRAAADSPHQDAAGPTERRIAELAARRRRQRSHDAPYALGKVARQHPFPHLLRCQLDHGMDATRGWPNSVDLLPLGARFAAL